MLTASRGTSSSPLCESDPSAGRFRRERDSKEGSSEDQEVGKRAEAQSGVVGYLRARPGESRKKRPICLCPLAQDGDPTGSSSTVCPSRRLATISPTSFLSPVHFPTHPTPYITLSDISPSSPILSNTTNIYEAKPFANKIRSQPLHRQCRSHGPQCATDHQAGQLIHGVALIFLMESKPHRRVGRALTQKNLYAESLNCFAFDALS